MPFIIRSHGTVVDAGAGDVDFNDGFTVGSVAPGVVIINIGDQAIVEAMLANGAVTAPKIAAGAVDGTHIADGSIVTAHIADDAITAAKIGAGEVTLAKLAANSVDSSKIVDDSIVNADVNSAAGIAFSKLEAIPGLIRTGVQSFTAQASVSLNNVFSSSYDHYKIVLALTPSGTSNSVQMRFRSSGVDNSSASYMRNLHFAQSNGATSPNDNAVLNGTVFFVISNGTVGYYASGVYDVFNPNVAAQTTLIGMETVYAANSTLRISQIAGIFNGSTVFDGFSLIPTAGTITGKVSVYGYN